MQIAFHIGSHFTDEGRLIRSVQRSRAAFVGAEILVPGPRTYRALLRETLNILKGEPASPEVRELLIDALVPDKSTARLVLFHDNLICLPPRAISEGGLYVTAPRRINAIRNLFPDHGCTFHLALQHPAALMESVLTQGGVEAPEALLAAVEPRRLRWLPLVRRLVESCPDLDLVLWCNEDAPLVWPQILRSLTGVAADVPFEGDLDMAVELMGKAGAAELVASLAKAPPADISEWTARVSEVLQAHALPEALDVPVASPGWAGDVIEEMTEAYLAECAALSTMPGIRFLTPG